MAFYSTEEWGPSPYTSFRCSLSQELPVSHTFHLASHRRDSPLPCTCYVQECLQHQHSTTSHPVIQKRCNVHKQKNKGAGIPFPRGIRLLASVLEGNCRLGAIVCGGRVSSLPGALQTAVNFLRLWSRPHPETPLPLVYQFYQPNITQQHAQNEVHDQDVSNKSP